MLGSQVVSDLHLESTHNFLDLKTTWGKKQFTDGLTSCVSTKGEIRKRQLPLLALYTEKSACTTIQSHLGNINTQIIDELTDSSDSLISESVTQILWKRDSIGAFLNTNQHVLSFISTWKTIILPGFALIMPLLAIVLPFFVLRFLNPDTPLDSSAYLMRVRTVLLQQISIPSVLTKWKGTGNDRMGYFLESLFIGLTLAMFISSLWNQVSSAMHLRSIWNDLSERGAAITNMITQSKSILTILHKLPLKNQKALRTLIDSGEVAIDGCAHIENGNLASFGAIWNNPEPIVKLRSWIATIDVLVGIAKLENICFPKVSDSGLVILDVYHPEIKSCVSNNFKSNGHTVLTGPNRGGKSTFCKSIGLAIITAQSWGFAWARSMNLRPFAHILTALEPTGKLGYYSTFEAEIEFAKDVLKQAAVGAPLFVMMDEIFHSTNASDGLAASRVFLDQLYSKTNVVSVISTHYKELADGFKDRGAVALQLLSDELEDGRLKYTYKVAEGVSTKRSVMEILIERGLVTAPAPAAPSETAPAPAAPSETAVDEPN